MNKDVGKAPNGADGVITRGKTAKNRLRRVDTFVLQYAPDLLKRSNSLYIDLGYGEEAFTTLESAQRFRHLNPSLPVIGVEIDPERVERAKAFQDANTHFRVGGFNLPLEKGEIPSLIRAFNVLRQYEVEDVIPSWQQMCAPMADGGMLIEGTSSPFGKIWTANLLRKQENDLIYEGFLFSTNFREGFSPEIFQPYLTKNFIHEIGTGSPIDRFMADWKRACAQTISIKTWGLRQWFCASAQVLSQKGYEISLKRTFLRQGFLLWKWDQPQI
ncbi:MAG: hypothetical protein V2J07_05445 [Anaerolineae bacterium]|jgi:hypothetical protein|nr:hypothetical protein [Anaerolineae bacterium]